jgi:hypothetical protein
LTFGRRLGFHALMTVEGDIATGGGSRKPRRRAFAIGLFVTLIACVPIIIFSKLLPTQFGVQVSTWIGVAVGMYAAWESRDGGTFGPPNMKLPAGQRGAWLLHSAWRRIPLMGAFAFAVAFAATEGGLLSLITAATGHPASRTVLVAGTQGGGRSCRRFSIDEVEILASSALCIPKSYRDEAVADRALTVFGKASPLGLNVERYELGPALKKQR